MAEGHVVSRAALFIDAPSALLVVGPQATLRLDGETADFARAALEKLEEPTDPGELRAWLESQAAGAPVSQELVDALLERLRGAGALGHAAADDTPAAYVPTALEGMRVVLAVSGAIAAAHAPLLVDLLQRRGAEVRALLSGGARRFVQRRVLEALTHFPVPASHWSGTAERPVPHIDLAEWADAVLLAPASATTVSRIAAGDCSDLVSALAISTRAPVLLAPSMNEAMLHAPSVARNLATLLEDGFSVLRTVRGIEVAERPGERRRKRGAAPAPQRIVEAFEVWWSQVRATRPERAGRADWDRAWRDRPNGGYAWEAEGLPSDLKDALLAHAAPPARLCDAGAGTGAQALEAAQLGYRVVAVDRSAEAIRLASSRPGAGEVVFFQDDVVCPRFASSFDVLLDRGTFHALTEDERSRYATSMGALVRNGGTVLVVHDAADASPSFGTARLAPEEVARAWPGFVLVASRRTTLRRGEEERAWLTVLRAER